MLSNSFFNLPIIAYFAASNAFIYRIRFNGEGPVTMKMKKLPRILTQFSFVNQSKPIDTLARCLSRFAVRLNFYRKAKFFQGFKNGEVII